MVDGEQKERFAERLARIDSGSSYVAPGLVYTLKGAKNRPVHLTGTTVQNARYPLSLAGAFVLGLVAVLIGQFVRVSLIGFGEQDHTSLFVASADLLMASAIIFALKNLFHMPTKELLMAQTVGMILMFVLMHNLVHLAPFPFELLFSKEWVEMIEDTTGLWTIRLGTIDVPLIEHESQVKELSFPQVGR